MAEKLLSDRSCVLARPKLKVYYKTDGHGLRLQVRPDGSRYWLLRFRWGGKESTCGLGKYPAVSLAAAREKAKAARAFIASGVHPSFARKEQKVKAVEQSRATFKVIAEEWLEREKKHWSPYHHERNAGLLRRVLYDELSDIPITGITAPLLLKVLLKTYDAGLMESARRARTIVGQVFSYAMETHRATHNPAAELARSKLLKKPEVKHLAALKSSEVGEFLRKLDRSQTEPVVKAALRLMLHTGLRDYAVRGARWKEINLDEQTWTVPSSRMKSKREFACPLPVQAIETLKELSKLTRRKADSFIFSSWGKAGFLAENTLRMSVRRCGYPVTAHGMRSLIAEKLTAEGFARDFVEKQLDHAERDRVRAAYVRSEFMAERRKMMQWWADWLEKEERG